MGFTKLVESIVESSVWAEDSETLRVWIYLLARADSMGVVWVTIPAIALQNGLTTDKVAAALEKFSAPDPNSRSPKHGGRRIRIDREPTFSIAILNYSDYRWEDHTHAARQKRYRESHRDGSDASRVSRGTQDRRQKTEDKEKDIPEVRRFSPPTAGEVQAYLDSIGETRFSGEGFCAFYESKGWRIGKSPMKSWQAAVRTWRANADKKGEPQVKKPVYVDGIAQIDREW